MMRYVVTDYKKEGRGKVSLCLNEGIRLWLYQGEARQLGLSVGSELSEDEYQSILHDVIGKRAVKRAMHLLERQDRTEHALREKLTQNAYPSEAVEDAISYVKRLHYLDDERFARNFIQIRQEKQSRMQLWSGLMRRGVPKEVIERCLEEEFASDEREQIRAPLEKKGYSPETADQAETRRAYQFLMRRGFRSSDALAVMRQEESVSRYL